MSVEETHEFEIDPFTGQPRLVVNRKETIVQRRGGGSGSGGGSAITVKDEGSTLTTALSSVNFTGSAVTASASGNDVTVNITGGGTPGGNDTELQYNDGGAFGGITGATTDGSVMTLVNPVIGVKDTEFTLKDDGDTTKTVNFDLSFITTGQNRLWTFPNTAGTFVATTATQTLTNKDISSSTNTYRAASDTATGAVELATAAETTTGTDATRAVTPDGLAGSDFGVRTIGLLVSDPGGSAITTGDGKVYARIPANMNGCNLIGVAASLSTVSSSGAVTVQVRRSRRTNATTRASADMLSTAITIDQSEFDTEDAATPAVINASNDDIVTGDHIYIDIDGAGTGAKGLFVALRFQLP